MALLLTLGNIYGPLNKILNILNILSVFVSFILYYYGHKVYSLIKDKNYKLFSIAFLMIAIAFIFKILSDLTILNRIEIREADFVFYLFSRFRYMQIINFFSLILYKVLYLTGFLILFLIIAKENDKEEISLFVYFSFITVLLSIYFDFIFHLTLVFLLVFISLHFYNNHKKLRSRNSLLVFSAFLMILIGHIFFAFSDISLLAHLIAEAFLLIGFLVLLVNQIQLKRKNEKTNKIGSNKRLVRGTSKK